MFMLMSPCSPKQDFNLTAVHTDSSNLIDTTWRVFCNVSGLCGTVFTAQRVCATTLGKIVHTPLPHSRDTPRGLWITDQIKSKSNHTVWDWAADCSRHVVPLVRRQKITSPKLLPFRLITSVRLRVAAARNCLTRESASLATSWQRLASGLLAHRSTYNCLASCSNNNGVVQAVTFAYHICWWVYCLIMFRYIGLCPKIYYYYCSPENNVTWFCTRSWLLY